MKNIDRNNQLLGKIRQDFLDGHLKYKGAIFFTLADKSKSLASIADTLAFIAIHFREKDEEVTS